MKQAVMDDWRIIGRYLKGTVKEHYKCPTGTQLTEEVISRGVNPDGTEWVQTINTRWKLGTPHVPDPPRYPDSKEVIPGWTK